MKRGLPGAGMWSVRGALASPRPQANMCDLGRKCDVGSADPAERLCARSPRMSGKPVPVLGGFRCGVIDF